MNAKRTVDLHSKWPVSANKEQWINIEEETDTIL